MPKLSPEMAKKAADADTGSSFVLLPIGNYRLRLTEVEATVTKSDKKDPMWVWKFDVVEPAQWAGKSYWERTVLTEKAMWKLHQVFSAFEAQPDVHTDDLIGQEVVAFLDQRVIGGGQRKGQLANELRDFLPKDTKVAEATDQTSEPAPGGSDDDPPF